MTPQPILFVDHAPAIGGAERSMLLLLKYLDRQRWDCHLAGVSGAVLQEAEQLGVTTHSIALPRLRRSPTVVQDWWFGVRELTHVIRQTKATLVIANTVRATLYAAVACKLAKCPFVWYMRDFWLSEAKPNRLWLDTGLKRLLLGVSTAVITNSQAVAQTLPPSDKINAIHNGIDLIYFDHNLDASGFRAEYQIPADAPLVGMVGRLRPWKGQDRFLRVARKVLDQHPDTYFLIVGGDPFGVADGYEAELAQLTHELGLAERVIFTSQLSDVRPALKSMDVFVHPGEPEPFGLVNVEAMAMQTAVVAFAHGALPEIIQDGQTGHLISPDDEDGTANAILALLDNSQQREQMGRLARVTVERQFSIQRVVSEVTAVFTAIKQGRYPTSE